MRLRKLFDSVDNGELAGAFFLTLTYPSEYPAVAVTKRHRLALFKRLYRLCPNVAIVWKLEPQKRGAPHYHLCVFGLAQRGRSRRKWLQHMRGWLAGAWYDIVGSGDIKHYRAGTQFDEVRNYRHAKSYVGKYLGKDQHELLDERPGRFWGHWGKLELYQGKRIDIYISGDQVADIFRCLDKWRLGVARRLKGVDRRRVAVRYARRRRADARSRWYACTVAEVLRLLSYGGVFVPDIETSAQASSSGP